MLAAANADQPDESRTYSYAADGSLWTGNGNGRYEYRDTGRPFHGPERVGGVAFAYDSNGNMKTGLDGREMTWDAENRLVKVIHTGRDANGASETVTTRYVYGADGARLKRIAKGKTTLTLPNYEVRDYGGAEETALLYPHPSVRIEGAGEDTETAYLHTDHLGSVRAISDKNGNRLERQTYRPYGTPSLLEDGLATDDHAWLGERFDPRAELMYLNARYHDPELGMFVSPDWFDPWEAGVGTQRYAYAGGDPVNAMDADGNAYASSSLEVSMDYSNQPGAHDYDWSRDVSSEGDSYTHQYTNGTYTISHGLVVASTNSITSYRDQGESFSSLTITPSSFLPAPVIVGARLCASNAVCRGYGIRLGRWVTSNILRSVLDISIDPLPNEVFNDGRISNPDRASSPIWQGLKSYKGKTKTNGKSGREKEFYEWDGIHNDIEVYDSKGRHKGSKDPVTGEIYKGPVRGRRLER